MGYAYTFHGAPLPKLSGLPITDATMNVGQQFLHLLSDPNIAFILFTIGFYGILSELFHPNLISGSLGAIAIVLAFIGSNSLPAQRRRAAADPAWGSACSCSSCTSPATASWRSGGVVCFVLGAFALYTARRRHQSGPGRRSARS